MTRDLDEDEEKSLAANIAWLESTGPEDWHRVALDFNWDEPLYLLDWIVRQPDCDVATALTIFWRGEPECWLVEDGEDDEEPNGFSYLNRKICAFIAKRVGEGGYTRSEIAFVPDTSSRSSYLALVAAEEAMENPNFRTHPDLIRDRAGRDVQLSDEFYRRYPQEFHHSFFSEQFSGDIERGVYETPESVALMKKVDEIDKATLRGLPGWLRPEPDAKEIQSEASSMVYNAILAGVVLSSLFTGGLSRFGNGLGWIVGSGVVACLSYGAIQAVREIGRMLRSCGWEISRTWLAVSLTSSLLLGAGVSILVLGHIGTWREKYGHVGAALFGVAVALPATWVAANLLVKVVLRSRSILDEPKA